MAGRFRRGWFASFVAVVVALGGVTVTGGPAKADTARQVKKHRRAIKVRALKQKGAPYVYGGASPTGFDCSGFALWVYRGHGASLPHGSLDQYRLAGSRGFKRIRRPSRLRRGDLVFFRTTGAVVGHVGIYTGHHRFVHASSAGGRVRTSSMRRYGAPFVGGTRIITAHS